MGAPEMGEGGAAEGGAVPAEIVRNTASSAGTAPTGAAELAMQDLATHDVQRVRKSATSPQLGDHDGEPKLTVDERPKIAYLNNGV